MDRTLGWGCLLFAAVFGVYLHGAYPSVSIGDSGEFMTAGALLGIPHPSGYPTYTLLAKATSLLVPWGHLGFRLNLFSVLAGAAVAGLFFAFLKALALADEAALAGTLWLAASTALIVSSRNTEVFALHALFATALLWAVAKNQMGFAGLLLGLGAGNHQTILLLFPAVLVGLFMANAEGRETTIGASLLKGFLGGLAGLSIYFFLYSRAHKQPFLDVGQPETWDHLLRVIRRSDYGSMTLALGDVPARTPLNAWYQIVRFLNGLADQVNWIGIAAGFLGLPFWFKTNRRMAWVLITAFTTTGPFFFWLGNLPFDAQSTGLLERFYILPTLCWVAIAAGSAGWLSSKSRGAVAFIGLLLAALVVQKAGHASFRDDYRAYAYAENNLRTMPPQTRLMIDGGDDTFYTLAYLTQVERQRMDIDLHDRGGVVFRSIYGDDFRQLNRTDKEARRQLVEKALLHSDRPLYYSTMNPDVLAGVPLQQAGILYAASSSTSSSEGWPFYDFRGAAPWGQPSSEALPNYRTRALVPYYSYQRAIQEGRLHHWDDAVLFMQSAEAQGPEVLWLKPNAINTLHIWAYQTFQAGETAASKRMCDLLLSWDRTDVIALLNRGAIYERGNDLNKAIADYERATQIQPNSANAHFNLAASLWKLSRWNEVVRELELVIAADPNYPRAQQYLQQAQMHLKAS